MTRKCRGFCIDSQILEKFEKYCKELGFRSCNDCLEDVLKKFIQVMESKKPIVEVLQEGGYVGKIFFTLNYRILNRLRQVADVLKVNIEDLLSNYFITWLETYIDVILHVKHEVSK